MSQAEAINKLSFEDALRELETLVKKLETGQVNLDEAVVAYERGSKLKDHCAQKLNEAKLKVDKIIQQQDGEVSLQEDVQLTES